MLLRNKIPSIYHPFFPELLDLEIPEEKIATCENCTLCLSANSPHIHTKCCSYYPHLPNYLVGGILQEENPSMAEGRRRIRDVIQQKKGVSPYGVIPPVAYTTRYKEVHKKNFWETTKEENLSLICPYFDRGRCSVWMYRENLCVTHFCTNISGAKGRTFWDKVNSYLKLAETELAKYALLKLEWPPEAVIPGYIEGSSLRLDDSEGKLKEAKYATLWRDWQGREEELFIRSFEIIRQIDRETFKQITGISRDILEQSIVNTQKGLAEAAFPDYLFFNPETRIEEKDEKKLSLTTDEGSTEIPTVILPLIKAFNGMRTTTEVCHMGYKVMIGLETELEKLIGIQALIPIERR